jgi:hypothetical protein
LALAAGVGVRFIVELEAGKPTVRLESLLKVLHALGGSLAVEGLTWHVTSKFGCGAHTLEPCHKWMAG